MAFISEGLLWDEAHADTAEITSTHIFKPGNQNQGATFYIVDAVSGTFVIQVLLESGWIDLTSDSHTGGTPTVIDISYALPSQVRVQFTPGAATASRIQVDVYAKGE